MNRRILLLLLTFLAACTSTSVVLAPRNNTLPVQVRFQPVQYETELTREHQQAIERVALAALRNRGFLVANNTDLNLPSILLTIKSLRRDSVLAGHVNRIAGSLEFFDEGGERIAAGEHTESERGGLLFNSGQILKGITSEIDNLGGDGFDDWIERFAMSLAGTLPKPSLSAENSTPNRQPVISEVHITRRKQSHEVCFKSPEAAEASLQIKQINFPMRRVQARSAFCVTVPEWLLAGIDYSAAKLQVTSPFGIRSTQTIILADMNSLCSNLQVSASPQNGTIEFSVQCGSQVRQCAMNTPCGPYTFRVYEVQDSGAFKLAGEFGIDGITIPHLSTAPVRQDNFRVFLLNGSDSFQKPVTLTFNSELGE